MAAYFAPARMIWVDVRKLVDWKVTVCGKRLDGGGGRGGSVVVVVT